MVRFSALVLGLGCLPAAHAADAPTLPRDTLPARLPIDAIPLGLPRERPVPPDNPLTEAKVVLGRRLFFDPVLSADRTVSCASCHQPEHGFASPTRMSVGVGGKQPPRHAPSLLNRAFGTRFFWDGREESLEAQALRPIENPLEMGATMADVVRRLEADATYASQFRTAFGVGVSADNLAKALASFERVLLTGNSRVDRFRTGEVTALSEGERHGLWLFESRGRCWRCHSGPNFTDEDFHNTGVGWGRVSPDLGRYAVTRKGPDRGRFKTPTLRGRAATAPYMHDGSLATLGEVVAYYNRGGDKNPHLDAALVPLGLSEQDQKDLAAFLRALSE
jgi:cytochrome c peroxidase